jgi:hypothetical protein
MPTEMGDKPSGLRLTSTTRHHRTSGLPHRGPSLIPRVGTGPEAAGRVQTRERLVTFRRLPPDRRTPWPGPT